MSTFMEHIHRDTDTAPLLQPGTSAASSLPPVASTTGAAKTAAPPLTAGRPRR